ncbi:conserved hypothetical protein [Agrobacterium deltaense RV3]|nr:conserved hypothetical protein [Agrobacterium deltaense RV3]
MLVGSHRADLGPKHEPGVTSNEGHSKSGSGVRGSVGIIYRNGTITALLRSSLFA